MKRMTWAFTLAFAIATAGCSGDGGGGGIGGGTEIEPNDDLFQATDLGSSGTHEVSGNTCRDEDSEDYFTLTAGSAGTLSVTLQWNEDDPDDDLDISLSDSDGFPIIDDDTPPAELETAVALGDVLFIVVTCYGAFDAVPYEGTATIP